MSDEKHCSGGNGAREAAGNVRDGPFRLQLSGDAVDRGGGADERQEAVFGALLSGFERRPDGIRRRRGAGYRHTLETLDQAPWRRPVDPTEGFILHEACAGGMVETAAASS